KDAKILRYDNGRIVFNKEIEKDTRIQIYNTNGALVKDIQVLKGTRALKVGKLPKGAYIYIIENKVGKIIVN
ncbi:MAG: T9SS type A sorting domain-containing protein, partial [Candidatus Hydrothermia bacterium]